MLRLSFAFVFFIFFCHLSWKYKNFETKWIQQSWITKITTNKLDFKSDSIFFCFAFSFIRSQMQPQMVVQICNLSSRYWKKNEIAYNNTYPYSVYFFLSRKKYSLTLIISINDSTNVKDTRKKTRNKPKQPQLYKSICKTN